MLKLFYYIEGVRHQFEQVLNELDLGCPSCKKIIVTITEPETAVEKIVQFNDHYKGCTSAKTP